MHLSPPGTVQLSPPWELNNVFRNIKKKYLPPPLGGMRTASGKVWGTLQRGGLPLQLQKTNLKKVSVQTTKSQRMAT
jgi:hypothetical protein